MTSLMNPDGYLAAALNTGVTYRQLVYWKARRFIVPSAPAPGSGSRDVWADRDTARLRTLRAYTDVAGASDVLGLLWKHLADEPFRPRWLVVHRGPDHVMDSDGPTAGNCVLLWHEGRP